MALRLNEDILTEEELQNEMDAKAEERERVLLFATDLFHDAGFEKEVTANYITFTQESDTYKALFSIDTTSFNYKCYVTTDNSNYNKTGSMSGIESAAHKFLEEVADCSEVE